MIISFGEVLVDCLPDKEVIGGAPFNVATHLNRLGAQVTFISALGKDKHAAKIKTFILNEGLSNTHIQENSFKTGYVSVLFNNGEPHYTIEKPCAWQYIQPVNNLKNFNLLIFGSLATYFKMNKETFKSIQKQNTEALTVCDLNIRFPFFDHEHAYFCLKHADIVKLNEDEVSILLKYFNTSTEKELVDTLINQFNIKLCLITKGIKGVFTYTPHETHKSKVIPLPNEDLIDPIGAGDAFTARFCYGILKNEDNYQNAKSSSLFATQICKFQGAIPPSKDWYQQYK